MRTLVGLVSALAILGACSSGDSSPAGSAGAGGASGESGAGGVAGSEKDASSDVATSDGGDAAVGLCDNPSDSVAVDAAYPVPDHDGGTIDMVYNRIARQCGLDCITQPDDAAQKACAIQCLQQQTSSAVSAGCTSCVVDAVICGRDHCLNDCLPADNWDGCVACLCGANVTGINCMKQFFEPCAGIPNTTCGGSADAGGQ